MCFIIVIQPMREGAFVYNVYDVHTSNWGGKRVCLYALTAINIFIAEKFEKPGLEMTRGSALRCLRCTVYAAYVVRLYYVIPTDRCSYLTLLRHTVLTNP